MKLVGVFKVTKSHMSIIFAIFFSDGEFLMRFFAGGIFNFLLSILVYPGLFMLSSHSNLRYIND